MKKGRRIEALEMVDIASNGKAVGKYDGQVIFVNDLVPGDVADIEVFKKRRRFVEARPTQLIKPSPFRTEARCQHFGVCGGCKWQHLTYDKQLDFKQHSVEENLKKLSGVELPEIQRIIGSPELFEYRNKLEYTFSDKRWLTQEEVDSGEDFSGQGAVGFHVPGRFDKVVDVQKCHLQIDISNELRNFIRSYALENDITFFNLRDQIGILRNLLVRTSSTGDLMLVLSVTEFNQKIEALLNELKDKFPSITSLNYVVNKKRNDTIGDLDVICFHGEDHIIEKMEHLSYKIGPKSFFQTNPKQAIELYKITKDLADIQSDDLVLDLYTGTGTIANYVAEKAKKVIGFEYVKEAVDDAKVNAEMNGISNTEFFDGDLQKLMDESFYDQHGHPDVIITDPPRAGMHADVVQKINESGARTVVYVSCNPATQARDLSLLDEKYEVVHVQPVDMFPHTAHVECVILLELRN